MNVGERLIKNTLIITVGNLGIKLVSFFLIPLYTALLTTAEYGTMDYLTTLAVFLAPFTSLVMDEAVFRFLVGCSSEDDRKQCVSQAFLIVLAGLTVFMGLALAIVRIFRIEYGWFLLAYVPLTVLSAFLSAVFRGMGKMKTYSAYNFAIGALTIVLNVVLIAILRMGLIGMMFASLIAQAASMIGFSLFCGVFRMLTFSRLRFDWLARMIGYALPLIPNRISWNAVALSSRVIITGALGSGANGLFALSNRFSALLNMVYGFFYQSWMESAFRAREQEGEQAAKRFYADTQRRLKRFMLSVVLMMIAAMPVIFRVMVDPAYAESIKIMPLLLFAVYFDSMSSFMGGIFAANMDTKVMGRTTFTAACVNVLLCLALIRWLELWAAAIAVLGANFVLFVLRSRAVRRYVRFEIEWRWLALAGAGTGAIVALFYRGTTLAAFVSMMLALAFAYASNHELIERLIQTQRRKRNA